MISVTIERVKTRCLVSFADINIVNRATWSDTRTAAEHIFSRIQLTCDGKPPPPPPYRKTKRDDASNSSVRGGGGTQKIIIIIKYRRLPELTCTTLRQFVLFRHNSFRLRPAAGARRGHFY